jgi:hypothetical protein
MLPPQDLVVTSQFFFFFLIFLRDFSIQFATLVGRKNKDMK